MILRSTMFDPEGINPQQLEHYAARWLVATDPEVDLDGMFLDENITYDSGWDTVNLLSISVDSWLFDPFVPRWIMLAHMDDPEVEGFWSEPVEVLSSVFRICGAVPGATYEVCGVTPDGEFVSCGPVPAATFQACQ